MVTCRQALGELKAEFPKADESPTVVFGECVRRAVNVTFAVHKGGVHVGRDSDGAGVLVPFNDTANLTCGTEVDPDDGGD